MSEKILQVTDIMEVLGVTRKKVYRMIQRGDFPNAFKEKRKYQIPQSDLDVYLQLQQATTASAEPASALEESTEEFTQKQQAMPSESEGLFFKNKEEQTPEELSEVTEIPKADKRGMELEEAQVTEMESLQTEEIEAERAAETEPEESVEATPEKLPDFEAAEPVETESEEVKTAEPVEVEPQESSSLEVSEALTSEPQSQEPVSPEVLEQELSEPVEAQIVEQSEEQETGDISQPETPLADTQESAPVFEETAETQLETHTSRVPQEQEPVLLRSVVDIGIVVTAWLEHGFGKLREVLEKYRAKKFHDPQEE